MKAALKNGEVTIKSLFEKSGVNEEELQELFNLKFESMTPDQRTDITNIIANKITKSYDKAKQTMMAL